jgi:hypothetical protein
MLPPLAPLVVVFDAAIPFTGPLSGGLMNAGCDENGSAWLYMTMKLLGVPNYSKECREKF